MVNFKKKIDKFLSDHGSETHVRTAYGMTECTAGVTMMPKRRSKKRQYRYSMS